MEIDIKREQERYVESVYKTVNELAEKAWLMGIEISEIRLKDNFIQEIPYGNKWIIKPPTIKKIETDYMTIKVR